MNRRNFLVTLATVTTGVALDPEQLLWRPGERTHILAPSNGWRFMGLDPSSEPGWTIGVKRLKKGDIFTIAGMFGLNGDLQRFVVHEAIEPDPQLRTVAELFHIRESRPMVAMAPTRYTQLEPATIVRGWHADAR